jgi:putative component of membrane protein insertase Oxa1/YidC/SpoIIIJ protein YidD
MKALLLVLISAFALSAQTDWTKWGKADFLYRKNISIENNAGSSPNAFEGKADAFSGHVPNVSHSRSEDPIQAVVNASVLAYKTLFSDVDGDNCPFRPSCSTFLMLSVKGTNIFQGTLMFFDRFTRDMNFTERDKHYPVIKDKHYYDPPGMYTLKMLKTIKSLP